MFELPKSKKIKNRGLPKVIYLHFSLRSTKRRATKISLYLLLDLSSKFLQIKISLSHQYALIMVYLHLNSPQWKFENPFHQWERKCFPYILFKKRYKVFYWPLKTDHWFTDQIVKKILYNMHWESSFFFLFVFMCTLFFLLTDHSFTGYIVKKFLCNMYDIFFSSNSYLWVSFLSCDSCHLCDSNYT